VEDACQSDRGDTSAVRTAYRRGDNACRIHGFPFLWRASRAKIWRPLSKTLEQKTVSAGLQPPGRMASGMHAHLSNLRARVRIFRAQKFACSEQEKACVLACGQGSGTLVGLGPGKAAKRGRARRTLQRSIPPACVGPWLAAGNSASGFCVTFNVTLQRLRLEARSDPLWGRARADKFPLEHPVSERASALQRQRTVIGQT